MIVWIKDNLGVAPCNTKLNSNVCRLDVRELVDGKGNDPALLKGIMKTGAKMVKDGKKLAVCCDMGISRSVVVAIGILTLLTKSFDNSVELVGSKINDQSVNLDLLEDARKCLNPQSHREPRKKQGSRILIAGSTGFIGRSVIDRLASQYSLFCLDENKIDLSRDVLSLYREVKKKETDLIINLTQHLPSNSLQALSRSVVMTRNLLEASRVNDTLLIHLSSLSVFDGHRDDSVVPLKSNIGRKPVSTNGQSAALCEELVQWYRDVHALNVTILRPSYIYGKNMNTSGFLWKFITKAVAGKPITVHRYLNGFQKFDFLHIDDFTDALAAAIHLSPSEDINLGTGVGISTYDMAKLIVKSAASKSKIDIRSVETHVANLIADTEKAQEVLNWRSKTSSTQVVKDLLSA